MDESSKTILDEIRARRRLTIGIVVTAVWLGWLTNVCASVFFEGLKESTAMKASVLIALILSLVLVLFATLREGITVTREFRLLFAFGKSGTAPWIGRMKGYEPSQYAKRNYSDLVSRDHALEELRQQVEGFIETHVSKDVFIANQVSEALIYDVLRLFGEHGLTTASQYHGKYRHFSWAFQPKKIRREELPYPLSDNIFIKGSLLVPQEVKLNFRQCKERSRINSSFSLYSRFAALAVEILPYWSELTEKNNRKTYRICTRNLDDKGEFWFITIPIRCTIHVRRHMIFSKGTEHIFGWLHGVMTEIENWLSFDVYMQDDLERLVVSCHRGIMDLKNMYKKT